MDEGHNPLKILALTRYGRQGASSRLRFEQFVPAFQKLGIDVEVSPLLSDAYLNRLYAGAGRSWLDITVDYLMRLPWLMRAKQYDLLWIEKELFPDLPAWFESLFAKLGIRYIVDYDDAIFHNYDLSKNPWRRTLVQKIDRVMRHASLVVCGNRYLAERAQSAGASRVTVLPTVIDIDRYAVRVKAPTETVVIGWVGSSATVKYLDLIIPALRQLSREFHLKLCVIGAKLKVEGIDVDNIPWSETDEVNQIQSFDIGIMPLLDSAWERGKCGYKLIQYMACSVPVVASPVGVNQEIVEDGVSGYLAGDTESWVEALRKLANAPERRRQFGARGRALVEERYCLQVVAPQMATLFKDISGTRR